MNTTFVPVQIVLPGLAAMLTDGTIVAVRVIVIVFEVALVGLAQASDEVITTLTWSPFTSVALE